MNIYLKPGFQTLQHSPTERYLTDIPQQREEYEVIYGTRWEKN